MSPSVVRQGLGTRLLTLTLDPGKLRGPLCTVTTSMARQASKVAQEEEEEVEEAFIMILLCQTDDFLRQPFAFIAEFLWASLPIYKETDRISRISSGFKSPILLFERENVPLT